jgi:hypothetical protein
MAAGEIHVGDIGVAIRVKLYDEKGGVLDVSTATIQLKLQPPSSPAFVVQATYVNDGKDGLIQYITQAGDLNKQGFWRLQTIVNFPSGSLHSDITSFEVYPNL